MHAVHLLGLVAGLAFMSATCAQTSLRDDEKRKKSTLPSPAAPAKSAPSTDERPYTPPTYRPRTERDYEPWRANRQAAPPKSSPSSTPKTHAVKSAAKPEPRDPALARCDDLKRRMEQLVREEGFGGDAASQQRIAEQKRAIYQDELRFGCI